MMAHAAAIRAAVQSIMLLIGISGANAIAFAALLLHPLDA